MRRQQPSITQSGFTILELMIAAAILSTMLLLVTAIMISIGVLYDKGINQARVQQAIRTISDDITGDIELNDGTVVTTLTPEDMDDTTQSQAYCVGTTRYTYIIGKQLAATTDSTHSEHVLWRDTNTSGTCAPLDLTNPDPTATAGASVSLASSGTELMAPNSRLTAFSITPSAGGGSPYTLAVNIAYGDSDLLCYYNPVSSDCNSSSPSQNIWNPDPPPAGSQILCKGTTGEQFCATASLTTTVAQRLTP